MAVVLYKCFCLSMQHVAYVGQCLNFQSDLTAQNISSHQIDCVGFFYNLKRTLIELMQSLVTKINDLDFLRLESSAWNF